MYWLKEDKFKLVCRYLYQKSDQHEGIKLNSRYVPLADTRNPAIDLNQGRGDEHHALYLGLNYYQCGENLKLVSGIQYDELKSNATQLYKGWTIGSGFRIWF
jgi:hypothetical protein